MKRLFRVGTPEIGAVHWGDLGSATPIGDGYGYHRGTPVDRYYIEQFLDHWSADIGGRVLEVQNARYAKRFAASQLSRIDVVDIDASNPHATIITDLNDAHELPTGAFDCIILTQTLQFIFKVQSAIRELERALAPGGVLLITVPGVTRIPLRHGNRWYWSFTRESVRRLVEEFFPSSAVQVNSRGNVKAATAFLHGLALEDLQRAELDKDDPEFQLVITARAQKAHGA